MNEESLNHKYRWEFLKRNDDFISDLSSLKELEKDSSYDAEILYEQILGRWGINFLIDVRSKYDPEKFMRNGLPFFTEEQRPQTVAKGVLTYNELPSFVKMKEIEGFETFANKFDVGDKVNDRRFAMVVVDLGADTTTRGKASGGNSEFKEVTQSLRGFRNRYRDSIGRSTQFYYEDELDLLLFIYDKLFTESKTRVECIEAVNKAWAKRYPERYLEKPRIDDTKLVTLKSKEVIKLINNINYFPYVIRKGFSPRLK